MVGGIIPLATKNRIGGISYMKLKEKIENILVSFQEHNKHYAIEVYIRNGVTGNFMTRLLIPINRNMQLEEKKFLMDWKVGDAECNELSVPYDEIMECYEENCEEDGLKIAEKVVVILKNGMKFEFECCGVKV